MYQNIVKEYKLKNDFVIDKLIQTSNMSNKIVIHTVEDEFDQYTKYKEISKTEKEELIRDWK